MHDSWLSIHYALHRSALRQRIIDTEAVAAV
jgi:hypothetical protein